MLNRDVKIFIIVLCIIFGVFIIFLISNVANQSQSSFHGMGSQNNIYSVNEWDGLPISTGNNVYHEPSSNTFSISLNQFKKHIKEFTDDQWNDDLLWESVISNYFPLIGWNGIIDGVSQVGDEINKKYAGRYHWFGDKIYEMADSPRFAVEVSARGLLHKAPLHQVVANSIANIGVNDLDKLFDFIETDLCYFRDTKSYGKIWISCAHGVGHGFGEIFGSEKLREAVDVCEYSTDNEFQYSCATGVYMKLNKDFPKEEHAPCSNNNFPASCYQFKSAKFFSSNPCSNSSLDLYHKMGCIWGEGFFSNGDPQKVYNSCSKYMPKANQDDSILASCVDGTLTNLEISISESKKNKMCGGYEKYPRVDEICRHYADSNFRDFSFSDKDFTYYSNYNLLELARNNS